MSRVRLLFSEAWSSITTNISTTFAATMTVLMVTHDREMVDKMRRRVIALEDGRLARDERRGGYE